MSHPPKPADIPQPLNKASSPCGSYGITGRETPDPVDINACSQHNSD